MAMNFELTAVARSLLNIEVNTIVRDNMTAEPMPSLPHALLDIARDYAGVVCGVGVNLQAYFADNAGEAENVDPGWTDNAASVSAQLTVSVKTFDRLRWAAKWALKTRPPLPIPPAKRVLLDRIVNNADAIKTMFRHFDQNFVATFEGKTRQDLLNMNVDASSYRIPPADLSLLQKIWDLGVEEIVAQTIVHLTGDVTTRVQEAFRQSQSEALFGIHRQSIDISVTCWKYLLDAVREIAGAAVGVLLGNRR